MPKRVSDRYQGRRRSKSSLLGVGLISCSIIAAAWIIKIKDPRISKPQDPILVGQFDTVELPVPLSPVAIGVAINDIEFKKVKFPKHQVPENAITELELLSGAITAAPLPASLPLFQENFTYVTQMKNPVIERIPQGMRAMTIKVDATSSVEGWAGSGSLVDVLLITNNQTSVVAEKVKILSAERSVAPVEGTALPNVPTTVTLLVTQSQCLRINMAIPLGKIAFALRNSSDESTWNTDSFTAERLNNPLEHQKRHISGFVTIAGKKENKRYALSNDRWVMTDAVPEGFFEQKNLQEINN